jgi:hypothetical protein
MPEGKPMPEGKTMRAALAFTPSESKRLIAKGVAAMPEVRSALSEGEIVVAHGSTNVYVAEELLGNCPQREQFMSGQVINGVLCQTAPEEKPPIIRIIRGQLMGPKPTMEETLRGFGATGVFIKGANAVDPDGNAGVLCAHPQGGTIGFAYGIISAHGLQLIVPVGLEKLVPSVPKAARHLGQETLYYHSGLKVGMLTITNGIVVTEIQALQNLFDVTAVHVGGGGVNGSEGSVVIAIEGEKAELDRAIKFYEGIKGEPPLKPRKALCLTCLPTSPSLMKSKAEQFTGSEKRHCIYQGRREDELPAFFKHRAPAG